MNDFKLKVFQTIDLIKSKNNFKLDFIQENFGAKIVAISLVSELENMNIITRDNNLYNVNHKEIQQLINSKEFKDFESKNIKIEKIYNISNAKKLDWTEEKPFYYLFLTLFLIACACAIFVGLIILLGHLNIVKI